MEEEKRAKLLDLIGRIMSTVGTITDAAALYICLLYTSDAADE